MQIPLFFRLRTAAKWRRGSCVRSRQALIPALPFRHVHLRGQKPLSSSYPTELQTVGDHLRKHRLDLGLLQRQAAGQLGVDTSTVTNWELGHTEPGFGWMPVIIGFLGYDPRPAPRTIGEALRRHRTNRGMTQKALVRYCTWTRAHWRAGKGRSGFRLVPTWRR